LSTSAARGHSGCSAAEPSAAANNTNTIGTKATVAGIETGVIRPKWAAVSGVEPAQAAVETASDWASHLRKVSHQRCGRDIRLAGR
jgi:hypothetical protein